MEEWKEIPIFDGRFLVSNLGRVKQAIRYDSQGRKDGGRILRLNKRDKDEKVRNCQPLCWSFGNSLGYVGEVCICAEDKEVRIGVCDDYYNFQIPFEAFLEIAKKVKELQ